MGLNIFWWASSIHKAAQFKAMQVLLQEFEHVIEAALWTLDRFQSSAGGQVANASEQLCVESAQTAT